MKHISHSRNGFTIVEMLVAIGIFSVVLSVAVGGFVNLLRSQRRAASLVAVDNNLSLALEQIAREVRTGYRFCRPGSNCAPPPGCPPLCPFVASNELDFINANGIYVTYCSANNAILKSTTQNAVCGDASFQAITSASVVVQRLQFTLFGNLQNDGWPPRVTISLGATSKEASISGLGIDLQVTVSARQIDS